MTIGIVMLCHNSLNRAAQVARHWATHDCPVVIHLDTRVPAARQKAFCADLADMADVRVISTHACGWGTWPIVAATQGAATLMLAEFPQVGHVLLTSGSCLPLRPVAALQAYLADRPDTDFIESVTTEDVGWTIGGLDIERFTLRFPFSWRKNRRLFDFYVGLQRRVGFQRNLPKGLVPHLGSQWWCLTRATLAAILNAPDRPAIDRYFRRVWIPDESYFQSLARSHARQIESRSLTLSKFDTQGRPHLFYDDHLPLLRKSDCFLARKIWPGANALYAAFLSDDPSIGASGDPNPGKIDRLFSKAAERRIRGRPGLYMQSRFPRDDRQNAKTAAPFSVLQGFAELFPDFEDWLTRHLGLRAHGHLFAPDRVHFAGGETVYNGALSDSAILRDYNPRAFLTNLIWNTRGERQIFQYGPADAQEIVPFLAWDANAHITVISGTWAIALLHQGRPAAELRPEAARLQRLEAAALEEWSRPNISAKVRVWSLAEFLETPLDNLQLVLNELGPRPTKALDALPPMADLTGLGVFLQDLRNQGMQPILVGDYPLGGVQPVVRRARPAAGAG